MLNLPKVRLTRHVLTLVCLFFSGSAMAQTSKTPAAPPSKPQTKNQDSAQPGMTPVPDEIMVREKIGADLNLDLAVTDDDGRTRPLSSFFKDGKPKIFIPVYYGCPLLCTVTLNRFIDAFKDVPYQPGPDLSVIAFSIDPREKPELAQKKKTAYLKAYPSAGKGWHFLTAGPKSIRAVTNAIGFGYRYDQASMEYLHRAAVVFLDGKGTVVRYLHGTDFKPAGLRLALLEAGGSTFGTMKDRIVASLFKYDSPSQRYVPNLFGVDHGAWSRLLCYG